MYIIPIVTITNVPSITTTPILNTGLELTGANIGSSSNSILKVKARNNEMENFSFVVSSYHQPHANKL